MVIPERPPIIWAWPAVVRELAISRLKARVRIRIGASSNTPPDVLLLLRRDGVH